MDCKVDGSYFYVENILSTKINWSLLSNMCSLCIWCYLAVKFITAWTVHPHISGHRISWRLFLYAEVNASSKHNHFNFKMMKDSKWKCTRSFKNCREKKKTPPFELLNSTSQIIIYLLISKVNFHRQYHMRHKSGFPRY